MSPTLENDNTHIVKEAKRMNEKEDEVLKFKKRILEWPNPVEYVNNMYGAHPGDEESDYFKVIFCK